jgi:opine dehydrogenase
MIVVPAFAQKAFIDVCAPYLKDGQVLLLSPGRTGGALMAEKALRENGVKANVMIAETSTLFYATRIVGPAQIMVYADKICLYTGVLPVSKTAETLRVINKIYPEFIGVSSILETGLYNIGGVFHPAPALLNAGWIESTGGNFKFYAEAMTPSVVRVMEAIEKERLDLCEAFGLKRKGIVDILNEYYGNLYPGWSLYEVAHRSEVYASVMGPPSMTARFISEEVPNTLVPMTLLGRASGVRTPTMDILVDVANTMNGYDYRKEGRTLEKLGLSGMSVAEIKKRVGL